MLNNRQRTLQHSTYICIEERQSNWTSTAEASIVENHRAHIDIQMAFIVVFENLEDHRYDQQ